MQVKIITNNSPTKLECEINEYLKHLEDKCMESRFYSLKIDSVKYSSTSCLNTNQIIYSAMIIYEV